RRPTPRPSASLPRKNLHPANPIDYPGRVSRVVGVMVALVLMSGTARADWWSVDIPSGWYSFSLPQATAGMDRVRKIPHVKQAELRMYSATNTVLAVATFITDDLSKDPSREELEAIDKKVSIGVSTGGGTRETGYDTDWVDDQLVATQT